MDLSTQYLGLSLKNPFVLGACPITADLDRLLHVVEAGAAAIVMHSLFEEQLTPALQPRVVDPGEVSDSMRPTQAESYATPHEYLQQLSQIKRRVNVPVIASLNGASSDGWLRYARNLEDAGADALELNVYHLTLDPEETASMIEHQLLEMVSRVTESIHIPVAVKLSPFYSGLPNLCRCLVHAGARGLVLFNRFYEPDIDVEALALEPRLRLSDSSELTLRLRWLAALSPKISASLAVSGGVHTGMDALKSIMAGAHTVQLVSAVLSGGPSVFTELRSELESWLTTHAYDGLRQAHGCMNLARCPDPTFYHRGNYLKVLQSHGRGRD